MSAFNTTPSPENPQKPEDQTLPTEAPQPTPSKTEASRETTPAQKTKDTPPSRHTEIAAKPESKNKKTKQILILSGLLLATLAAILLQKNAYVASMSNTLTVAEYEPEGGTVLSTQPRKENKEILATPPDKPLTPARQTAVDTSTSKDVNAPEATASSDTNNQITYKIIRTEKSKLGSRLYILVKNKTVLEVKRKGDIKTLLEAPKGIITVSTKEIPRSSLKKFASEREKLTEKEGTKTFLEIDEVIETK
jgi:hypothetical protein